MTAFDGVFNLSYKNSCQQKVKMIYVLREGHPYFISC